VTVATQDDINTAFNGSCASGAANVSLTINSTALGTLSFPSILDLESIYIADNGGLQQVEFPNATAIGGVTVSNTTSLQRFDLPNANIKSVMLTDVPALQSFNSPLAVGGADAMLWVTNASALTVYPFANATTMEFVNLINITTAAVANPVAVFPLLSSAKNIKIDAACASMPLLAEGNLYSSGPLTGCVPLPAIKSLKLVRLNGWRATWPNDTDSSTSYQGTFGDPLVYTPLGSAPLTVTQNAYIGHATGIDGNEDVNDGAPDADPNASPPPLSKADFSNLQSVGGVLTVTGNANWGFDFGGLTTVQRLNMSGNGGATTLPGNFQGLQYAESIYLNGHFDR
jgi:hypothetical protein